MKISCLLLDDDPLVLDLLRAYVSMTDVLDIKATFTDPLEAHRYLLEKPVQVLFSDVTMPHLSGLDLVRSLHNPPLVVLMTSYPQYAMEGFNLDICDLLLKPISPERFLKAVAKVTELLRPAPTPETTAGSFYVTTDSQLVHLHYHDVLYAEALRDATQINMADGRSHRTATNLQHLEAQLPASMFVRTHPAYLVNATRVEAWEEQQVRVGGRALPLGGLYRDQLTAHHTQRAG